MDGVNQILCTRLEFAVDSCSTSQTLNPKYKPLAAQACKAAVHQHIICHAQSRCFALQGQDVCTSSYCHSVCSVNTMLFICSNVTVGCIVTLCKDAIEHAVPTKLANVAPLTSALCSFSISWHEFDRNISFPPTATHTCNGHNSEILKARPVPAVKRGSGMALNQETTAMKPSCANKMFASISQPVCKCKSMCKCLLGQTGVIFLHHHKHICTSAVLSMCALSSRYDLEGQCWSGAHVSFAYGDIECTHILVCN